MNALTQELSVHEIRQRTGHPDRPLHEAYEQVEHGILTPAEFRDFTFTNAVRFYGGTEPGFFAGTAVESAAREVAAGAGGPA